MSHTASGRTYYEEETDSEHVKGVYRSSRYLDDKYEVLRRHRVNRESFEDWVIRQLSLTGDESILDVGCGQGRFLLPIARLAKGKRGRVVGCDLSEGVMAPIRKAARAEGMAVELVVADAQALPFESDTFDLVMANHMLYHLPSIVAGLKLMSRVMRSDGRLLATTNSQRGMPELLALHLRTMGELGIPFDPHVDEPFTFENGAEVLGQVFGDLELLTYDAGFEVVDPEPVLKYYMATQLYQGPHNDPDIPEPTRAAIADTFRRQTSNMISLAGGKFVISKPVAAFIARGISTRSHAHWSRGEVPR